jgi:protein-tyrosine phosphatase
MVDIHHHLLPGLDDGSKSLDMSVEMARIASSEGITHIVCTPHANGHFQFDPALIASRLTELRQRLADAKIAITLGQGCDFHLSYDNIADARANPGRYAINGLSYLLVELPDFSLPPGLTETFYELQLAGLTPILTHPERNPTLAAEPARMADWLRGGLLIQVTADSLTGHKGKPAQRMALDLLEKRWVHFLATDAHNTTSRPPRLRDAFQLVAEKFTPSYAHALCITNPLAAFLGKPFEVEEDPRGLYDAERSDSTGFWQRLTSRFRKS